MKFDYNTDTGLIRMYGVIGDDEWDEGVISATMFMEALDAMDGQDITIHLKSPGGEIDQGLSIYSQIDRYPGNVTVEVDTQAASIATVFPMAANRVVMRKRSEMFIHDPWTIAIGNAVEFRHVADYLDALAMEIAEVYAEKAGGEPQAWFDLMRETKRYSAEEAVAAGLADCVLGCDDGKKKKQARADDLPVASLRLRAFATGHSLDKRRRIRQYSE